MSPQAQIPEDGQSDEQAEKKEIVVPQTRMIATLYGRGRTQLNESSSDSTLGSVSVFSTIVSAMFVVMYSKCLRRSGTEAVPLPKWKEQRSELFLQYAILKPLKE